MKIISPTLNLEKEAPLDEVAGIIRELDGKADPFLILQHDDMTYMQTLWTPEGFCLEYQEGTTDRHYESKSLLDEETVISCLKAYLAGDSSWENITEFEQKVIRDIPFSLGRTIGRFIHGFILGLR
jgi:hypothetical protein